MQDFVVAPALQVRGLGYLSIESRPPTDFIRTSQVGWRASSHSPLGIWERARLRYSLRDEIKQWGY